MKKIALSNNNVNESEKMVTFPELNEGTIIQDDFLQPLRELVKEIKKDQNKD